MLVYGAASWAEALQLAGQLPVRTFGARSPVLGTRQLGLRKASQSERLDLDILDPRTILATRRASIKFPRPIGDRRRPVVVSDLRNLWPARRPPRSPGAFTELPRGANVAGHTYVIHWAQSGLHSLRPGHAPDWSAERRRAILSGRRKGLVVDISAAPTRSLVYTGEVPTDW